RGRADAPPPPPPPPAPPPRHLLPPPLPHSLGIGRLRLLHVRRPVTQQVIDDPRQLVRRRRDRLRRPQPTPLPTQIRPQITRTPHQTPGRQPQRPRRPPLALPRPARLHLPPGLLPVRTQPQPTGEVLDRRPLREIRA